MCSLSLISVEDSVGEMLLKGQEVKVIGSSSRRGYLLVEYGHRVIQVPYHVTEIRVIKQCLNIYNAGCFPKLSHI